MKIAAVNFNAVFANVDENIKQVADYVKQAADLGVELILFPEFFTSSMGRSIEMLDVPIKSGHVAGLLLQLAAQYNIIIGGSYIIFNGRDAHNLFQLVFPDGSIFSHKKDIPTIAENCYYTCGDTNNILKTPIGDIGVALCWEMNRYDTLKRLSQKVDIVLAGSCWEDLREGAPLREYNKQFALQTPVTFAKLLHVPVIHSNHCGKVTAVDFYDENNPFTFQMVGAAQIIDEDGNIIARRSFDEGEGMVISEISLDRGKRKPADINYNRYWIEDMQQPYIYAWENFSSICKDYYNNVAKPYYFKMPSYLKSTADSTILKAKGLQNENTISFIFFTDPHISDTSSFTDIASLNYISNNLETEFTACCGDNFDNVPSKQLHLGVADKFIKSLTVERFFTVKGNHDDNSIQSEGSDNIRYTMLPQEQYDIMFKRLEETVSFDASNKYGLYYYYDIPESRIRAIFLNSIDIPYIPSTSKPSAWKYSGQSTYAYSDRQLNWLAHTALKLPSDDWKVIFFTHINPFNEGMIGADNLAHNSSVLLGIINAFKSGRSFTSISSTDDFAHSVSVDFTSRGEGKVIAFFYGHTHSEQVLCRDGIKYISTWNDCPRKSASNPEAPVRTTGTISEVCLNVVTLDLKQDKIFMTKFGAGEDLVIDLK